MGMRGVREGFFGMSGVLTLKKERVWSLTRKRSVLLYKLPIQNVNFSILYFLVIYITNKNAYFF